MYGRQDQVSRLLRQPFSSEMIDDLERVVTQECRYPDGRYFSGFIGTFADALVFLGEQRRLKVTNDNGGRVVEAVKE